MNAYEAKQERRRERLEARAMFAAHKRALSAPMTAIPMIGDPHLARIDALTGARAMLERRACQYAAWIAERDQLGNREPRPLWLRRVVYRLGQPRTALVRNVKPRLLLGVGREADAEPLIGVARPPLYPAVRPVPCAPREALAMPRPGRLLLAGARTSPKRKLRVWFVSTPLMVFFSRSGITCGRCPGRRGNRRRYRRDCRQHWTW